MTSVQRRFIFLLLIMSLLKPLTSLEIPKFSFQISDGVKTVTKKSEDNFMDFTEIVSRNGYSSERHSVVTQDGYILTLYRLLSKQCLKLKKPPVLLMHGLLLSSDSWLDAGPNISLAYLMADECYDLWVGNVRGNYLGRTHVKLNPDRDKEFWNFSFDEMGLYDAPALIDHIIHVTGAKQINYVGYSQGAGMFAIMCSEKPEYCDKVITFIGLAPAAKMKNTKSNVFTLASNFMKTFSSSLARKGIHEVFGRKSFTQQFLENTCQMRGTSAFCNFIIQIIDSLDPGSYNDETIRRMFSHVPSGTSVKNLIKFAQSFRTEKFQKFDYGRKRNLEMYGDQTAPEYNLSKIMLPVLIIHGLNDNIVDISDAKWLKENLSNAELKVVNHPFWNHFDVLYSRFIPELLFPLVNQHLLRYQL